MNITVTGQGKDGIVQLNIQPMGNALYEAEKAVVLIAIKEFPDKRSAAKFLGITLKTLYNYLHKYGVPVGPSSRTASR